MRKCINCKGYVRDNDKYCRKCGTMIVSNKSYIIVNIINILLIIGIIFMILLFVASYLVNK